MYLYIDNMFITGIANPYIVITLLKTPFIISKKKERNRNYNNLHIVIFIIIIIYYYRIKNENLMKTYSGKIIKNQKNFNS